MAVWRLQLRLGFGTQALDVPLLMGVLWWLLLLGTHHWAERLLTSSGWTASPFVRAAVAATLMTALDGAIEPVAIRAGWWTGMMEPFFGPIMRRGGWLFALGLLWKDVEDLKTNRLSGLLVLVLPASLSC